MAVTEGKNQVKPIDINIREIIETITIEGVMSLSFSSDGDYLAMSKNRDEEVYIWDQRTTSLNHYWPSKSLADISSIAWVDGKHILCVGLDDGNVFLWDMVSRRVVTGPLYHPGGPCLVSVFSDGKTLVAGTGEGCLKVWGIDELLSSTGSQTVSRLGLQSDVMWSPFREGWLVGPNSEWLVWVPEE